MVSLKKHFKDIFTLDLRALGFARVLVSIILIWTILERLISVEPFFSDLGAIPLQMIKTATPWPWMFSFYHLSGDSSLQTGWLFLELLAAICLLVGFKTRYANILCWIFLCSAQTRNPLILYGGDEALRIILFWMIFLPTDFYLSIEKKVFLTAPADHPQNYFSLASAAFMAQILLLYFFSGIHKINSFWIQGDALNYIFSGTHLVKPLGHIFLNLMSADALRTVGTGVLILELCLPLIFLIAPARSRWHFLFPVLLIFFHLFLDLTLRVEFFPYISIAALLVFFRSDFFMRSQKFTSVVTENLSAPKKGLLAVFLVLAVLANIHTAITHERDESWLGTTIEAVQLQQDWSMFSIPYTSDGLIYAESVTQGGTLIDLLSKGEITSDDAAPTSLLDKLQYPRWLRLISNTTFLRKGPYRFDNLALWYCRQQNHSAEESKKIHSMEIKMKFWQIPQPATALPDVKKATLGIYNCP